MRTHMHAHTHSVCLGLSICLYLSVCLSLITQGKGTEEMFFEKRKIFKEEFKRTDRSSMTDRVREVVPGCWSLAR